MFGLLRQIVSQAVERVSTQILTYAPGLLAALFIMAVTLIIAGAVRWILFQIFKWAPVDRFLRRSSLSSILDRWSGRPRTSQIVGQTAYWAILVLGALAALSSFNPEIMPRAIETAVVLLPKLLVAAAIIVIGAWLGRYFGRSTLVWAVNEDLPSPRKLAACVRAVFTFGGVVAAADQLNFARNVFLAAFILVVGGIVLTASLALGRAGGEIVRRYFHAEKSTLEEDGDQRPLWRHL